MKVKEKTTHGTIQSFNNVKSRYTIFAPINVVVITIRWVRDITAYVAAFRVHMTKFGKTPSKHR
jgi:hypothetical protein